MRALSFASLFALVASSFAFSTAPPLRKVRFRFADRSVAYFSEHVYLTMTTRRQPITRMSLMTHDESEALITKVNDCAEGECGIDDVSELVYTLQEQEKELSNRLKQVRDMIQALDTVNGADDRKVDEVRETVRAIFRIFQMGDSSKSGPSLIKPVGWSGEVGKGPTTAYDALPPKRITKPQA